jgi:hypothetical protein
VKIHLNTRPADGYDWHNELLELQQVPRVGEHIALSEAGAVSWHRVVLVVWAGFAAPFDAEIYAKPVELVAAVQDATHH